MTTSPLSDAEIADLKSRTTFVHMLCIEREIVSRLLAEVEAARKALKEIHRIVHVPTPRGTSAYVHFMRDFDQVRALCRQSLPSPENKDEGRAALRRLTQPQNAAAGEDGK